MRHVPSRSSGSKLANRRHGNQQAVPQSLGQYFVLLLRLMLLTRGLQWRQRTKQLQYGDKVYKLQAWSANQR